MPDNDTLKKAYKAKKDEFYTQLTDIEKELRYYRKHFKGKTVFCNKPLLFVKFVNITEETE